MSLVCGAEPDAAALAWDALPLWSEQGPQKQAKQGTPYAQRSSPFHTARHPPPLEGYPLAHFALWQGTGMCHGGATTIGPDATHPPAICQNLRRGGHLGRRGGVSGRVGGGGYWRYGGGVVPRGGGAACDPLLPHAYLKGVCVFGGMGV